MAESNEAPKSPATRALMINVVLSIFVSVIVFSVASFGIIVPHMYDTKRQVDVLNEKVVELEARLAAAEASAKPEEAAAPAEQPAAPAEQPAAPAEQPAADAPKP